MAIHSSIVAQKIPWAEKSDYSPWGCKELDTTEHAHIHLSVCLSICLSVFVVIKEHNIVKCLGFEIILIGFIYWHCHCLSLGCYLTS